jgi:Kae1-associated kinase Bud32
MNMTLPKGVILRRGAEAVLIKGTWSGEDGVTKDVVFKVREPKAYRHPDLDARLRSERTSIEGKIITSLWHAGLPVPRVFEVDLPAGTIVLEHVLGERLKDVVPSLGKSILQGMMHRIGEAVAAMHARDIIHGDLTTSNVIVVDAEGTDFRIIDFGLSRHTSSVEDKSVDLHLFKRVVTSTHASAFDDLFPPFMDGYRVGMESAGKGEQFARIDARMQAIETRGRYVQKKKRK